MIDARTEAIIRLYMQWSPTTTLTPEAFLQFRRQAVEEELAGIREAPLLTATREAVPLSKARRPAEMPRTADSLRGIKKQAAGKPQETANQNTGPSGMIDAEFLAFMQSVED